MLYYFFNNLAKFDLSCEVGPAKANLPLLRFFTRGNFGLKSILHVALMELTQRHSFVTAEVS